MAHVLGKHLDKFFDTAEVEVDPPKGNYQVINRCGVTGELLGPPNYHRYNQIVMQHYTGKIGARMPLDIFRGRIETIRDPEVVNQWLAKMKKTTRYTWKLDAAGKPLVKVAVESPAAAVVPDAVAVAGETPASEAPAVPPSGITPAVATVPAFDSLEDARVYLLTQARDKVVRTSENARFHGSIAETLPPGEIRRALEGAVDRQRRFPLDTANALRGRLRREHFTIFKKGSKGVSYVCAVKRKFRVPGQTFADSIGALINFIETHPMVRASELAAKFLGLVAPTPASAKLSEPVAPAADVATAAVPAPVASKTAFTLTIEERAKLARLQGDLIWLVREGYVTELIDGRLFAPPPMIEARKKEIEAEDHDPENFPDVPVSAAPAVTTVVVAVESPAPPVVVPAEVASSEAASSEAASSEAASSEVASSEVASSEVIAVEVASSEISGQTASSEIASSEISGQTASSQAVASEAAPIEGSQSEPPAASAVT
ncbi:MAG: hypothetical protein RL077_5264 [Verrucomicrobiota bacterium]